jgi:hypothetical protein
MFFPMWEAEPIENKTKVSTPEEDASSLTGRGGGENFRPHEMAGK